MPLFINKMVSECNADDLQFQLTTFSFYRLSGNFGLTPLLPEQEAAKANQDNYHQVLHGFTGFWFVAEVLTALLPVLQMLLYGVMAVR